MLKIDACALEAPPPISIGPTVDLIRRASVLTDVKPWLIRWSAEHRHGKIRRVVQHVAISQGRAVQTIARVFEQDDTHVRKAAHEAEHAAAAGDLDTILLVQYLKRKEPMSNEPADLLASMSPAQKAVLREQGEDFGWFMPTLAERLNLDIAEVRIACRANKAIGLFHYGHCVDEEEGTLRGSAYLRTELGQRVLDLMERVEDPEVPSYG